MMLPWQAYQKLYYESRIKPVVEWEWAAYKANNPDIRRLERIQHLNKITRRLFEAESDEVKAEVEIHRWDLYNGTTNSDDDEKRTEEILE